MNGKKTFSKTALIRRERFAADFSNYIRVANRARQGKDEKKEKTIPGTECYFPRL